MRLVTTANQNQMHQCVLCVSMPVITVMVAHLLIAYHVQARNRRRIYLAANALTLPIRIATSVPSKISAFAEDVHVNLITSQIRCSQFASQNAPQDLWEQKAAHAHYVHRDVSPASQLHFAMHASQAFSCAKVNESPALKIVFNVSV